MFLRQGAYTYWQCACPTFELPPLHDMLFQLQSLLSTSRFQRTASCSLDTLSLPNTMPHTIKNLLQAKKVPHLAFRIREEHPCCPIRRLPVSMNNSRWIPFVATLPPTESEFALPGRSPDHGSHGCAPPCLKARPTKPILLKENSPQPYSHLYRKQISGIPEI